MSLDQIVSAIVDDADASPYLRAIRLYELQVAIFYSADFQKLIAATDHARGASKRLRTARIYAGIKFLEHIEDKLREQEKINTISIRDLAQNSSYQNIFDNIIVPSGGWLRIRHAASVDAFEKRILEQRNLASAAAKLVDFSYRFDGMPDRGTYKGGVTTARYVVVNAKSYQFTGKKSTIKSRWRKFKPTAAFLYLLQIQKFPLLPPRLSSKNFAERLLMQAQDIVGLRNFFRAYQHVCDVLAPRGYKFKKLSLNLNFDAPPLATAALQSDVIAAFNDSKGAKE